MDGVTTVAMHLKAGDRELLVCRQSRNGRRHEWWLRRLNGAAEPRASDRLELLASEAESMVRRVTLTKRAAR